jgi:hypothetical protein
MADWGLEPTKGEMDGNGTGKATCCDPDGNELGLGGAVL